MADEKKSWLEVSLQCSGELAEAVAEVFARYCPEGVVLDNITRYDAEKHEHIPTGMMRVAAYLPLDDELESKKRSLEEALWYMGRIVPLAAPEFVSIADQDWMTVWKQNYQPLRIGKSWLILPAWLEVPEGETRRVVRIDPAMAFGTGTHPSTQLCLLGVEEYALGAETVIDLGCGSGILSIAALKLGVRHALAVDIDEQAVIATLNNARINAIGDELEAEQGSLADILAGKYALKQAPLVLANILAPVLVRLFDEGLARLVAPGGKLVLAGILENQAEDVLSAARAQGMDLIARYQQEDWVALVVA
ncbi:MAG: 50S ribosomal protein L11 methyltransferase [Chloroflexi bacterium]|nr:50S ribosomal protein L11 methyltransferase [Chloroflexota bacterium]HOG77163.1 50S ribosomal protein L11 methyltransferase [Anaerolineaceae bacterium]